MLLAVVAALAALVLRGVSLLVSYITGSHAFPKPLTEDEEREYLRRRDEGDEDARNTLIERNLRLGAHIVKKFENTGESVEDLISVGTIGSSRPYGPLIWTRTRDWLLTPLAASRTRS